MEESASFCKCKVQKGKLLLKLSFYNLALVTFEMFENCEKAF